MPAQRLVLAKYASLNVDVCIKYATLADSSAPVQLAHGWTDFTDLNLY